VLLRIDCTRRQVFGVIVIARSMRNTIKNSAAVKKLPRLALIASGVVAILMLIGVKGWIDKDLADSTLARFLLNGIVIMLGVWIASRITRRVTDS
jgi:hypothetical protein